LALKDFAGRVLDRHNIPVLYTLEVIISHTVGGVWGRNNKISLKVEAQATCNQNVITFKDTMR